MLFSVLIVLGSVSVLFSYCVCIGHIYLGLGSCVATILEGAAQSDKSVCSFCILIIWKAQGVPQL